MTQRLDLTPTSVRRRQAVLASLRAWGLVWLLGIVAVTTAHWAAKGRLADVRSQLAAQQRRVAPVNRLRGQVKARRQQLAELAAVRRQFDRLLDKRPPAVLLSIVSRQAANCQPPPHLELLELECERDDDRPARAKLRGAAASPLGVMQFVSALRDSGAFATVELQSSAPHRDGHSFHIQSAY